MHNKLTLGPCGPPGPGSPGGPTGPYKDIHTHTQTDKEN